MKLAEDGSVEQFGFNLSYSSYSMYESSQLQFFFSYISGKAPDTKVVEAYGDAGNVVHSVLEEALKGTLKFEVLDVDFENRWRAKLLTSKPGINGKPLDSAKYLLYVKRGIRYIKEKLQNGKIDSELKLEFRSDEYHNMLIKGFLDIAQVENGEVFLYDWKTNGSFDDDTHTSQRLFYSWLYYKIHGIIPKKCTWIYLVQSSIKDQEVCESFELDAILAFDKKIKVFIEEILTKKNDIEKYEPGEFNSPFNGFYNSCVEEVNRRGTKNIIQGVIENNVLTVENVPAKMAAVITQKYSYKVPGAEFSMQYKKRFWDGIKKLAVVKVNKHNRIVATMPYSYINDFKQLLDDYNSYYNQNMILSIDDRRNAQITSKVYKTSFTQSEIELRYYQHDAIKAILDKKIGILYGGTGMGKSLVAAEVIKLLNRRTMFIVNRIELLNQTKEVFEDYLGVEIGIMSEGAIDTTKQITIASIQTLFAVLKRNDESTKQLRLYMHNVTACIFDECQNVSDAGSYGVVSKALTNVVYFVGLSGSPWRTAGDTLELNALCGFPIYTKTTAELEAEGYLVSSSCYFVKHKYENEDELNDLEYHEVYDKYVVENEARNQIALDFITKYRTNKKILVLAKKVVHLKRLGELIPNSFVITGSSEKEYRKQKFKEFKTEQGSVLVGSAKIFSAGIDIPDLDIVINMSGHKSDIDTVQIIGRVKRKSEGKTSGYFIDFADNCPYLRSAFKERKSILEKFGNVVRVVDSIESVDID